MYRALIIGGAESFSQAAFNAVALNGAPKLTCCRKTDARKLRLLLSRIVTILHNHGSGDKLIAGTRNLQEFLPDCETRECHRRELSAQALASFGATCCDHTTASDSAHASAESVAAFTYQITGLKCTFHCTLFTLFIQRGRVV